MLTVKTADFERVIVTDQFPDSSFLEQEGWEDRLQAYHNDEFYFVGVRARVNLRFAYGMDSIVSLLESPGLWGIESDSGEEYLQSVYEEELDTLKDMLAQAGIVIVD